MVDYEDSNNKGFRYLIVILDNCSKYLWCVPLKNKNSQIITNGFSNIITTSKRSFVELESDRGAEFTMMFFRTS